jgi:hypothetical protein
MNIFDLFDINKPVSETLSAQSGWKDFSNYFMFLTLKNGGCSKSSSGALNVVFPSHFEEDFTISVELGGYDTQTFSRHDYVSAETEQSLKELLIERFETERLEQLDSKEGNEEDENVFSASMD